LRRESVAAYHPFSGSEQVLLFQLLDSPPHNDFSRALMIFSVAEALLTRVVVVDERLADATASKKDLQATWTLFQAKTERLQKARIYPLYSVESENSDKYGAIKGLYHALSDTAWEGLNNTKVENPNHPITEMEGMTISPISLLHPDRRKERDVQVTNIKASEASDESQKTFKRTSQSQAVYGERIKKDPDNITANHAMLSDSDPPDFIVIHEGVTDMLASVGAWPKDAHEELFNLCTCIVRTSGRGSVARHLNNYLPFLEFSEISDTTYRQMNKIALGKGLLSLRGPPRRDKYVVNNS
jgi:hypothetical protein